MKIRSYTSRRLFRFTALLPLLSLCCTLQAQTTRYWSGTDDWDTTTALWGTTSGGPYNTVWTNGDEAILEGTVGTITLTEPITASGIDFATANSGYVIEGNTLNLAGATVTRSGKDQNHTITSAITGAPNVDIVRNTNGGGQNGLTFAPNSGTVALGTCRIPTDDASGEGNKAGLTLGGTTTGNTVTEITFENPDHYWGQLAKDGPGEWIVGDVTIGEIRINDGDLIANGTINPRSNRWLDVNNGGTLHYNNPGAVERNLRINSGASIDNTSGAAITTSDHDPNQAWEGAFTFLGSNGALSDLNLGSGTVSLNNDCQLTVQNASATLTVNGSVDDGSGINGLTKAGPGTLLLAGNNNYQGATTALAGTLSIGDGSSAGSLDDAAILEIASGATLDANWVGTDTVFALTFDGLLQAIGTWGRIGSTADFTDARITGDGLINNLGGAGPADTYFWDGDPTGGNGNGASDGGGGTWSTASANWDVGLPPREVWTNDAAHKAIFGGTKGTVTVDGTITVGEIEFNGTDYDYLIDSGTLDFSSGGTITNLVPATNHTITSAITGSPDVRVIDSGNGDRGFTFAPATGSMALGTCTLPFEGGNGDKCGFTLAGSTTGNTITSITYEGGDRFGTIDKEGTSTWTVGDVNTGQFFLKSGTLIVNGTLSCDWLTFNFQDGTLGGSGTIQENVVVPATGTVTPGNSAGTLTIDGNLDLSDMAGGSGTLDFELDSLAGTSDQIAVTGTLTIGVGILGFSDFDFTNLGGLGAGIYTLVTSGGLNGGDSLDGADLMGTIGSFDAQLQVNGANIELVITSGTPTPYADWAASQVPPLTGGFDDDQDGGGTSNGEEWYFFDSDPNVIEGLGSPIIGTVKTAADKFEFAHNRPVVRDDVTETYQWSSDLATWRGSGISDGGGTTVTVADKGVVPGPTAGYETVTKEATVTGVPLNKLFVRLKLDVTGP